SIGTKNLHMNAELRSECSTVRISHMLTYTSLVFRVEMYANKVFVISLLLNILEYLSSRRILRELSARQNNHMGSSVSPLNIPCPILTAPQSPTHLPGKP
ncbi:hypothetical protein HHI36_001526, partial [Cryptolaemus montrouzieri]